MRVGMMEAELMSKYRISATKKVTIDGVEYQTNIDKDVAINFSTSEYQVCVQKDEDGDIEIELIPSNTDFLHEITDIFPLSEFSIRIVQTVFWRGSQYVSLDLDIKNRATGENVFFAESAVLSDHDYDHIRKILAKEVPQYTWQTAEEHLRTGIEQCVVEECDGAFTDEAAYYLGRMVANRYQEIKTEGYVDFDFDMMEEMKKKTLEDALRCACDA